MVISPIGRLWSNLTVEIPWNLRTEDLYIKTREQWHRHKMNLNLCYFQNLRSQIFNFWKKASKCNLLKECATRVYLTKYNDVLNARTGITEWKNWYFWFFRKSIKRKVSIKSFHQESHQDECTKMKWLLGPS